MKCQKCGTKLIEGHEFCHECGTKFVKRKNSVLPKTLDVVIALFALIGIALALM